MMRILKAEHRTATDFRPEGTADNSPTFQRWEPAPNASLVPKGRLNEHEVSAVPSGLAEFDGRLPNVETLGYSQTSLRDKGDRTGQPQNPRDRGLPLRSATGRGPGVSATERAFTMIEIAISLAIIGFALVAIIGILPAAMSVQKDNRQETIINQDATLFMNAMRNGDRGLDDLTNYVVAITNYAKSYNNRGGFVSQDTWGYTPLVSSHNGGLTAPQLPITNGFRIVGLLSTPKLVFSPGGFTSNHVVAFVRSLSGPASEKYPQNDPTVQDLALNYRLTPEVLGYGINTWYTNNNYIPPPPRPNATTNELFAYTNFLRFTLTYATNVHDVRLTFRWPLKPNGDPGPGRQLYRTLVSGPLTNDPPGSPFYFFQPHNYISGT